ncbi:6-bladed beta-propeller [Flavivirga aquimarina]|uniref:6-bladed beta-propeller n=1 Tax=Flavivirga aquimarina TaxID=2027862 RepID=A0ABT8WC81_9FLAO|nr:6-bladed beta-propeller [Flavivirga aquimarina]MDO5970754.1 6-bladed beta-propeller [Flavivirga aquimarina]
MYKNFKLKKYLLFLLISISFFKCKIDSRNTHKTVALSNNAKTLNFEINKNIFITSFDSIFKKEKLIKLETKPISLITNVYRVDYYNNNIYIIDSGTDYSVTCFDSKGTFKFKLKKIGRGPHEYTKIVYGAVNDYNGDIEIIANMGRDFIVYDSLGNFKERTKLPYTAKSFCSLKSKRYFYKGYVEQSENENTNFRVYSTNYTGKDIKKYLPYLVSKNPEAGSHYLYGFSKRKKGEYRFVEKYNDTVYKINSETFTPLYKINFVGYEDNKPDNFLYDSEKYGNQMKKAKELKIPSISNFQEYDSYITGKYTKIKNKKEYVYRFIYDKINKKIIQNRSMVPLSRRLNINTPELLPDFSMNGTPSCYIYPVDIDNYINDSRLNHYEDEKKRRHELTSYFEYDGNVDANPYILQYKPLK